MAEKMTEKIVRLRSQAKICLELVLHEISFVVSKLCSRLLAHRFGLPQLKILVHKISTPSNLYEINLVFKKAIKYSTYSRYISNLWTSSVLLGKEKKEKASKKNSFDVLSPNSISFFHFRLL